MNLPAVPPPTGTDLGTQTAIVLQVEAFGVLVDVTGLSEPESLEFKQAWNRCLTDQSHEAAATVDLAAGDFARAHESLTSTITLSAIEKQSGKLMMFHACGLADLKTGSTVVFIASSGTGKTTLARTLGPELGYVSDETIAVRQDLTILPYPKPLSVKQAVAGSAKVQESPDQHGLGVTPLNPVLRALTLLNREEPGKDSWLESVPLLDAIFAMIPETSALSRLDRGLVQLCTMIEACGGVTRIHYSEAASISAYLPELRELHTAPITPAWESLDITVAKDNESAQDSESAEAYTTAHSTPSNRFRRTEIDDAVTIDGIVVLLHNSELIELGPLGGVIWQLCQDWVEHNEILSHLLEVFGDNPNAQDALTSALESLVEKRLLEAPGLVLGS